MNNKLDTIYNKCFNAVNCDFAKEIDDLAESIINEQRNNHIYRLRDLKEEHANHMNKIISELEKEKEHCETRRIMRRNLIHK